MMTKNLPASVTSTDRHNGNGFAAANVSKGKYTTTRPKAQAPHNAMVAWAYRYASNYGWRVLPVLDKVPATDHGHLDATTIDPARPEDGADAIRRMFDARRHNGVGVRMGGDGKANGGKYLVAPEIDEREKGGGNLQDFYRLAGVRMGEYRTPTMKTPGGWRMICYVPTFQDCDYGDLHVAPGIEIKGDGGQVVLPPSLHPLGKRYQWVEGLEPWNVDVAPVPAMLFEKIKRQTRQTPQDAPGTVQAAGSGRWTLEDVQGMLAVLDPWQDGYDWWLSILAALHSEFGDDALPLAESWADGKPGEVEKKFRSFRKTGVTLGTLVYHARRNGWKPAGADDEDDASIPEHWRITSEDWNSCPVCAPLHTEEFSDGTVRTFHKWCRKTTCKVYRKFKMRSTLAPVFRWTAVRSQEVPADDWRQWREDAATRGVNYRAPELANGARLALYEVPAGEGEDLDALLERAADAVLSNVTARAAHRAKRKQARQFLDSLPTDTPLDPATMDRMKAALDVLATKGPGNVSTPRRRRNLADGAIPGPSPKERPHPVGKIIVSRFAHRKRIFGILDRLGIEWERQRLGGWKTAPLSDGQRIALRTALEFGVPGARSLNSAIGTTGELTQDARWDEPYPRTVREYIHGCFRDRIPIQINAWEAPKF